MSASFWQKWLANPGHIRLVTLEGTELVRALSAQQKLQGLACQGYAEALVGSLLIASAHKSNESINMNAKGSAWFKQAIVDASPEGRVRGFLIEEKDPSMHTFGLSGLNGPWGSGVLSILYTKNFEGKIPYTGMVPISTGFLDEAINEYYRDSEQLTSKIGLVVEFDGTTIRRARGVLVQALGGATDAERAAIDKLSIATLRQWAADTDPEFGETLSQARTALEVPAWNSVERQNVIGFCTCSQERIERALILTGEADVLDALGEDPYLEATCDFCRTQYRVSRERIKSLFLPDPSRLQ